MKNYNYTYLISICLVAALGGLLFGYDWVVIGGAKPFYELYFQITDSPGLQGWAISSALVGCVSGAVIAGAIADVYGRKKLLILAAVFFTVSAYGTGAANSYHYFVIYRIIGGIGIGMASTLSPMYIAEIAPPKTRGLFVSINQLTIVLGILGAQLTNMLITKPIPINFTSIEILESWNGQFGWRWMFWGELVPAGLFFILLFFVPESPRFLAKIGNTKRSTAILSKVGGSNYAQEEQLHIQHTLQNNHHKVSLKELTNKKSISVIVIGIV